MAASADSELSWPQVANQQLAAALTQLRIALQQQQPQPQLQHGSAHGPRSPQAAPSGHAEQLLHLASVKPRQQQPQAQIPHSLVFDSATMQPGTGLSGYQVTHVPLSAFQDAAYDAQTATLVNSQNLVQVVQTLPGQHLVQPLGGQQPVQHLLQTLVPQPSPTHTSLDAVFLDSGSDLLADDVRLLASAGLVYNTADRESLLELTNSSLLSSTVSDITGTSDNTSASLYVKNLSPDADELYLYQKFAPYGALLSCRIKTDAATGKCRGVGFVNFVDQSSALRAMQRLHGTRTPDGRQLHITLQAPRAVRTAAAAAAAATGTLSALNCTSTSTNIHGVNTHSTSTTSPRNSQQSWPGSSAHISQQALLATLTAGTGAESLLAYWPGHSM